MDPFKNFVDCMVPAPAVPPTLDNGLVVAIDKDARAKWEDGVQHNDEEFKANSLCPGDVPTICLPWGNELEGRPGGANCEPEANAHS